ncbi:hypothetical protein [Raoultibacter phocaeensis]|uniref:hypothetical protein n=1 Tax=Raoultibacter phocaeensis TaxID=2479841 RepID=UPI00210291E2|nr:hypothetical protein [Raoultibacter phocaeensis]
MKMFGMDGGILALPKIEVPLEDSHLAKTPEQLGVDTIVLENVPGSKVVLASTANPHEVEAESPDFPSRASGRRPAKTTPATSASSRGRRCPTHNSPRARLRNG